MDEAFELVEKIRQQFEAVPYPSDPLEQSPKDDTNLLFIHNLITSYYLRNQEVIKTEGKVILDAGCGSGYTSLILAQANPGAKIIGIDLSEESVKIAYQRLHYHGFNNVDFFTLPIQDLLSLEMQFDYINSDEVLYLMPDPVVGLQAMKSVLKPDGIIRTNLHSSRQRLEYYQAQKFFKLMGLMDKTPQEFEIRLVQETMKALKDKVILKQRTWQSDFEKDLGGVLVNFLLQGDKGYTINEVFAALKNTDLEFISMVNWRHWELMDLFKEPENLPVFLAMTLAELSMEERLHLFELLHPVHRLLDFWCGNTNQGSSFVPVSTWTLSDWQTARVHLHPQLSKPQVKENLIDCITNQKPFEISHYVKASTIGSVELDSTVAACLLPLWEGTQPFISLVERWLKVRPLHPVTLEPLNYRAAFDDVKKLLSSLEVHLYVLLEQSTLSL